jgi:hypothetical protein
LEGRTWLEASCQDPIVANPVQLPYTAHPSPSADSGAEHPDPRSPAPSHSIPKPHRSAGVRAGVPNARDGTRRSRRCPEDPERRLGTRAATCDCAGGDAPNARFRLCRPGRIRLSVGGEPSRPTSTLFTRVLFARRCSDSVSGQVGMRPGPVPIAARVALSPWARGGRAAGRLPGERVRGGEPAAQLVVKVGGCGDADAVGE